MKARVKCKSCKDEREFDGEELDGITPHVAAHPCIERDFDLEVTVNPPPGLIGEIAESMKRAQDLVDADRRRKGGEHYFDKFPVEQEP